jgi:hypothetical protein
MDENSNETAETAAPAASNAAEKSVQFVNAEVLSPPTASPMGGVAKVMIEQSAGMMVQDLQSFLKGFEQVGLIALSRLANNLLTYGSPSAPTGKSSSSASVEDEAQIQGTGSGNNDMMKDLFKMVNDYAEMKAKISNTIYNATPLHPIPETKQNSPLFTDVSAEAEDPEKKNG